MRSGVDFSFMLILFFEDKMIKSDFTNWLLEVHKTMCSLSAYSVPERTPRVLLLLLQRLPLELCVLFTERINNSQKEA